MISWGEDQSPRPIFLSGDKMNYILLVIGMMLAFQSNSKINSHSFLWEAKSLSTETFYYGKGEANLIRHAFDSAQETLDDFAKDGLVEDGERFEVTISWKNKDFARVLVAHKECPNKLGSLNAS